MRKLPVKYFLATCITLILYQGCKKVEQKRTPAADFDFSILNTGQLPDTVKFRSLSVDATSWKWNFGDGSFSTVESPAHVYQFLGKYRVTLYAINNDGIDSASRDVTISMDGPEASFSFKHRNPGVLPDTVDFVSKSTNASSLLWSFENKNDTASATYFVYTHPGDFEVKLTASNAAGIDSVVQLVSITGVRAMADFELQIGDQEKLPVLVQLTNTSQGMINSFHWYIRSYSQGLVIESFAMNPTVALLYGDRYSITLVVETPSGLDSTVKIIQITPYPIYYQPMCDQVLLRRYAWPSKKIMLLSESTDYDRMLMYKWMKIMDSAYSYLQLCSTREPGRDTLTYIDNKATIADVEITVGNSFGNTGKTGVELADNSFQKIFQGIRDRDQYEHFLFKELADNFWFYGDQLTYNNLTTLAEGYSIFMAMMIIRNLGIKGAAVGTLSYEEYVRSIEELVDKYAANNVYNWSTTLNMGAGLGGGDNGGGPELFASFCLRLQRDYGGEAFVRQFWKKMGQRPIAITTQDAVDNFFLASCGAAQKNLTNLFISWRLPLSDVAKIFAAQYP